MKLEFKRPRDYVAKDLRTAKYRMRVVSSELIYNRNKEKRKLEKELFYG
jgi:hypothetical protein